MLSQISAIILTVLLSPVIVLMAIIIYLTSGSPILFKQNRVGVNGELFVLYKFRTMKNNTPDIATHLVDDPNKYFIKYGALIRKLSLDELPQFYNIIIGDMVFIGPRPALYNQNDLIELRNKNNIDLLKPGITGWAQVNGRDNISIKEKVQLEKYYLNNKSIFLDGKILLLTLVKVLFISDINH